jgi:hypothetical protein
MTKFRVGDKVKIVRNGLGLPLSAIGKIATITDVGGTYCGGEGVKIAGFKNPPYEDWIGVDSFVLISRKYRDDPIQRAIDEAVEQIKGNL